MAILTIEQWLNGMVDFNVPDTTLSAILLNNNVDSGISAANVPVRERELCLADLYVWLSSSSTSTSGEYISDGGWQHQKANKTVVDRNGLRARAIELYKKWGSEKAETTQSASIVMKPLY